MTDGTTARDRAIEGLARRIESQALISDRPGQLDELEQIAREVRALAGAPTADVAMLAAESAAIANSGTCTCTEDEACWDHEALEMRAEHLLAAAPEGVDAADERFPRPRVAGRCPSCGGSSLFLGSGGHVTCSRQDCPAPGVVDDQLHGEGAPTADVAADLPARLRAAADEAWEIRGITAAIKLGELARTLDKYPADAVEAIARVLAAAPTADVAEAPTLDRDGYDEEFVLRAARTFADGGQVGHPPTVVAELLAMIARRDAPLAAAPEGVDAADEQEPCLSRGCTAPRGHADDHESADGDTWDNSIDDPGDDGADLEAQGEMADRLAAAQAAIQVAQKVLYALQPGAMVDARSRMDAWRALRDALRALDGDTTEEGR